MKFNDVFICNKCGTEHKIYGDLAKGICIGCDEKEQSAK